MEKAKFVKYIGNSLNGFNFIVMLKDENSSTRKKWKSFKFSGNIPSDLPSGTILDITFSYNKEKKSGIVSDYNIDVDKNSYLLYKNGVNIKEFKKNMESHKTTGVLWKDLSNIKENPYAYYKDFKKADEIYKNVGGEKTSKVRCKAISRELLKRARNRRKSVYSLNEYYNMVDKIEEEGAFERMNYIDKFRICNSDKFIYDNKNIKDIELYRARDYIGYEMRKRLGRRTELVPKDFIDRYLSEINSLNEEQKDAVRDLATNRNLVITGGAGVGKTTVIEYILDCYGKYGNVNDICLLAPTGKASRRIAEKTGFDAKTIHSELRKFDLVGTVEEGTTNAFYNEYNPLPYKIVIVDESSMIDTLLMYDLLKAIPFEAKIIFIGDHNQLPPVGCGEPFFDYISKNLCHVVRLTKNYRQGANDILPNAENILANMPMFSGKGVYIKTINKDDIKDYIDNDLQIISPFNDINKEINNIKKKGNNRFNIGDKVVGLVNTESYSNGDLGEIVRIDDMGMYVKFDEFNAIEYVEKKNYCNFELAYALTVHKMQGSECDDVILFLPKESNSFIDKRLLYTAITRAKNNIWIYYYI